MKYKISFLLTSSGKPKEKNKLVPIYFQYRRGREFDFRASLGIKVYPKDWNYQSQRLRQKANIKHREFINGFLSELESYFDNATFEILKSRKHPTKKQIKLLYQNFIAPPDDAKKSFFEFIETFIENAKTKPNKLTKRVVSNGTLRGYKTSKAILMLFDKERYRLDFDDITIKFYYDFIEFCENKNLSYNYIGKHIKTIKVFMSNAVDDKLTANLDFQKKEFAVLKEETDAIYLSEKELSRIYDLELLDIPRLDIARDLFLIGAYTGLRVSDFRQLSKDNIQVLNDVEMLKVRPQKTGKIVVIPLHPKVKSILQKYKGELPPQLAPQTINVAIKEIGKMAKIDSNTHDTITKGGIERRVIKPKYELIRTHTARRSFCTNAYLQGMPMIDIMALSGHKKESSFLKYIKVSEEQRAVKLSKHKFFNDSVLKMIK